MIHRRYDEARPVSKELKGSFHRLLHILSSRDDELMAGSFQPKRPVYLCALTQLPAWVDAALCNTALVASKPARAYSRGSRRRYAGRITSSE